MIKTFISTEISELDKMVNDFQEINGPGPVRTEVYTVPSEEGTIIVHKCTVFYEEYRKPKSAIQNDPIMKKLDQALAEEEILEEDRQVEYQKSDKAKNEKLGALWIWKDGSLHGKLNEQNWPTKPLPEDFIKAVKALRPGEHLDKTIGLEKVVIMGNKFKKDNPKAPDYIIFKRRE